LRLSTAGGAKKILASKILITIILSVSEVTLLLEQISAGDNQAAGNLLPLVYEELRRRAASYMSHERPDHTLEATALVHEAYLKLVGGEKLQFQSRAHFYNAAAEAMRRILVDHARSRGAGKRGGNRQRLEIENIDLASQGRDDLDLESLDQALTALGAQDQRRYRVVMLRYFAGLSEQQIAETSNLSLKTVQRDWATAKLFLLDKMRQ
jgi:RNA polymerase sigma factor (TIGR02999 family)